MSSSGLIVLSVTKQFRKRFGHNLVEQIKQTMVDLNISRVTELHYENCDDHPLRIKIDFEEFPLDSFFKVAAK